MTDIRVFAAAEITTAPLEHHNSESGARIASEVICDAIELFAKNVSKGMLHAERQKRLKIFEKNIIYRWRKAVEEDVAIYPFTDEELKELSDKDKQRVKDNIWLAYGTTLQCVIKVEDYWYVIKLGDGNIVGIKGDIIIEPIDQDPRLKFNYTTSLCGEDAFDCIKDAIIPCAEYDAFIITSDGVYNSFDDDVLRELLDKVVRNDGKGKLLRRSQGKKDSA